MASKKILISGGTGLIGNALTKLLLKQSFEVHHLSRNKGDSKIPTHQWDIRNRQIDEAALEETHAVIHLAGAGVADQRWTEARKEAILKSRVDSTRLLYNQISKLSKKPAVFVAASAVGIYGFDTGDDLVNEDTPAGSDFLAKVVEAWEEETEKIKALGVRVVKLRIGIVLAREGGALPKIAQPVKLMVGAPLGSGKQYMSWIHIEDVARMFQKAIEDDAMHGIYNCVGPDPVTNKAMTKCIAASLNKPLLLPNVPAFVIKLMFGEMANIVLGGNRVSNEKITQAGFHYKFNALEDALVDILKH